MNLTHPGRPGARMRITTITTITTTTIIIR